VENAQLVLPEPTEVDLLLLSAAGAPVWQAEAVQFTGEAIQIPTANVTAGFYLLQIRYPSRVETLKIVKR